MLPRSAASRALVLSPRQATADLCLCRRHLLRGRSGSVSMGSLGPGVQKVLFELSEHLRRIWGLILNMISHLLPSCLGFSFALGRRVSFFGGIQHSPLDGCLAVSCNFEVLGGEDECLSFYSAISDNTSVVHGQPKWWVRKESQRILSRDELVIIYLKVQIKSKWPHKLGLLNSGRGRREDTGKSRQ